MPADLSHISAQAALYLIPTGFCDPEPGGGTMALAGTAVHFSALRVIAARYGRREHEILVPIGDWQQAAASLPQALRGRADELFANITSKRDPVLLSGGRGLALDRSHLVGILNVTPDSFSDGGKHIDTAAAIAYGHALAAAGAALIDVGGESTRPGAQPVWEGDELKRVVPVVEALAGAGIPVSTDTRKAAVMRAAMAAGAAMINDVTALTYDPEAMAAVAECGVAVVLMHSLGDPSTMQENPRYDDVLLDVFDWLEGRIAACADSGIARSRIVVDPGIGFGKTLRHNLALMNGLAIFHGLGCPVMLGASRKSFIGALTRVEVAAERVAGSVAAAMMGAEQGVQMLRVHDVVETAQAMAVRNGARDVAMMPLTP